MSYGIVRAITTVLQDYVAHAEFRFNLILFEKRVFRNGFHTVCRANTAADLRIRATLSTRGKSR